LGIKQLEILEISTSVAASACGKKAAVAVPDDGLAWCKGEPASHRYEYPPWTLDVYRQSFGRRDAALVQNEFSDVVPIAEDCL
jgi:hypothetical protein